MKHEIVLKYYDQECLQIFILFLCLYQELQLLKGVIFWLEFTLFF